MRAGEMGGTRNVLYKEHLVCQVRSSPTVPDLSVDTAEIPLLFAVEKSV